LSARTGTGSAGPTDSRLGAGIGLWIGVGLGALVALVIIVGVVLIVAFRWRQAASYEYDSATEIGQDTSGSFLTTVGITPSDFENPMTYNVLTLWCE
jgi:hypothetical protein